MRLKKLHIRVFWATFAMLILSAGIINAQAGGNPEKTIKSIKSELETAKELYSNKLYQSAYDKLSQLAKEWEVLSNKEKIEIQEIEGYKVLSLIKLDQPNAHNCAAAYEKKFPFSPMLGEIKFQNAILYFDNEEYAKAGEILNSINRKDIPKSRRPEYNFRRGYCLMRLGYTQEAINIFSGIISEGNSLYLTPSYYYCGYLHYINKDFYKAIPLFEKAVGDTRFSTLCKYHLLESNFMVKDYNNVINNGASLYEEIDSNYKSKVARIISEAYYAVNDTEKARYYFELYSVSSSSLSKADNFYAGMIAYTLNNHISAADAFSKVASSRDSLGQNAAYHLAQSYIQLKNKHAALKAFKLASESNFDPTIKEDAFFNYAKLSFDINRNMSPIDEYLRSYSFTNTKWDEIHSYIATAFLMNSNYEEAIKALKKIKNTTPDTRQNLYKAEFLRAMQLIRNGSFTNAIPYLTEITSAGNSNQALKNLGNFWLAECFYRRDEFDKSINIISSLQKSQQFRLSNEFSTSVYNMAYNFFKKGDYAQAVSLFQSYLGFEPEKCKYGREAKLRMADCHFMQRDYLKAAEMYELIAVNEGYSDLYVPLQGAMAYGLMDNTTKKCALLEEIASNSNSKNLPLYTQAMYELGRTYIQDVQDEKAEKIFNQLLKNPEESAYYYKAMLELGMINANRKSYETALAYYKKIVEKAPLTEEAQSALSGIENIYQAKNRPEEFLAYLENVGLSSIKTTNEKESMLFNAAEQIFLSGNYTAALASLSSFLEKYPDGNKAAQANFYMAECYNSEGKLEKAAEYYYKVMSTQDGAFSEISTLNYGRICYKLERYNDAAYAYETLSQIAQLNNNKLEAQTGKMKSYFMCKNYSQSLIEAKELLDIQGLDNTHQRQGNYYLAKSHLALGNREEALPHLKQLAGTPADTYGAEAAYLLVEDAYNAGDFANVEKRTFEFSDAGTSQTYWLAKSFIILGDSYAEQGNFEQASATFNSIRENYRPENADDITDLLKIRLNKLSQIQTENNQER